VLCHLGVIDRDRKQTGALLGGQQGAAGHDGLVSMAGTVHNGIAFGSHSEEAIERKISRTRHGCQLHAQMLVL
jgi:hypothetical protein